MGRIDRLFDGSNAHLLDPELHTAEQSALIETLGGTTCLFCGEERSLKPNCTKRWKVCNSHFMITCPICGHEAFWMEGMKSGDYYACFSLSCNWTDRVPPNDNEIRGWRCQREEI